MKIKPTVFILLMLVFSSFFLTKKDSKANLYWNQAASFAGSEDSYLAVEDDTDLDITGDFTIEAWVNPSDALSPPLQMILQKRQATISGYTLYLFHGKVAIRTIGGTRLIGKTVIPSNQWTHIAGTYKASLGRFIVHINGSIDTIATVSSAAPTANSDSLIIGKGTGDPFGGMMDEIRIWNVDNTDFIYKYHRTSLAVSSGKYAGLLYSLTFQDDDNAGDPFSLVDYSFKNSNAKNNGVTPVDLSNRPSNTIHTNDCINLDGNDDYLATPDSPEISPTSGITISAWIYPRAIFTSFIILKGPPGGGPGTNYCIGLSANNVYAIINGSQIIPGSATEISLNRWSHVAFTYDASNGNYKFFINGKNVYNGDRIPANINNGADSLYIGGTTSLTDFNGYIDEVSIIPEAKSEEFIGDNMYRSRNLANVNSQNEVVYNFDGYSTSNSGVVTDIGKQMYFRNDAEFTHNGGFDNAPESPMIGMNGMAFQEGYYLKSSDRLIPETGTSGSMMSDTLEILQSASVTDINLFIGLNHIREVDLQITLTNPAGNTVTVFDDITFLGSSGNLVTVFNDQADSSLLTNRYTHIAPQVKPLNTMISVFGLQNMKGKWILNITDQLGGASGRLYGWGIQFNNQTSKPKKLNLTAFIQGFYNESTNLMIRDTLKFYLRDQLSPHAIVDSAKAYASALGFSDVNFTKAVAGRQYYLSVKHRNLVETWSTSTVNFNPLTYQLTYDFTNDLSTAYGNNLIQVDAIPLRYAFYNGDVNQDNTVDIGDLTLIDNDAFNFNSGYIPSDVNGDGITDIADNALTDNNAFNFVGAIVPSAPPPMEDTKELTGTIPSNISDQSIDINNIIINKNDDTDVGTNIR